MGSDALVSELIDIFREDTPRMLADLSDGLDRDDPELAHRASHALKGQLGNYFAQDAFEAARVLDEAARSGDLVEARRLQAGLIAAIDRLGQELDALQRTLDGNSG